jgi:F0F1-type ATP synthase assembly protein I
MGPGNGSSGEVVSSNSLGRTAGQSLKILWWQLAWIAATALAGGVIYGARAGWSVLAGGGIASVWTAYMAFTLYRHSLNRGASLSALTFVTAWLLKMAITIGLLVMAFRSGVLAPLGLIAGLFVALLAYWVWLAFGLSQRKPAASGSADRGKG